MTPQLVRKTAGPWVSDAGSEQIPVLPESFGEVDRRFRLAAAQTLTH